MRVVRSRSEDGVRFPTLLLGLFVIPLVLISGLLAMVSSGLVQRARAADRSAVALEVENRVDAAQRALFAELLPTLGPILAAQVPDLLDPTASEAEITEEVHRLVTASEPAGQLQASTDRALAAIGAEPAMVGRARAELDAFRAVAASSDGRLSNATTHFESASDQLARISFSRAVPLVRSSQSTGLAAAVLTVQNVRPYVAAARLEAALRPLAELLGDDVLRSQWVAAWGNSQALTAAIESSANGAVATAWVTAVSDAAVQRSHVRSEAYLASELALPGKLTLAQLDDVIAGLADARVADARYDGVLGIAAGQVLDQIDTERSEAVSALRLVMLLAAVAVVAVLVIGTVLIRSITRPLARLAEDARQISEGVLLDVRPSGPREVRTVARALGSAVATLRRVQRQAEALSHNHLDAEVLHEAVPGPLGEVLHESIERAFATAQQRDRLQREMAHLAVHDSLTGLPNRGEIVARLHQALGRADVFGSGVGLLFLDLDHFKRINDTFGHSAGDKVLATVARRLQGEVRGEDVVGRLGGDEFVVLMSPVDDEAVLAGLAERLIARITEPIEVLGREVTVGVSIGMSLTRGPAPDASQLLSEADAAAYRAKANGRGRVDRFDDELRVQLATRGQLEADLAAGLSRGEFVLHYQPVIAVATGEVDGVEALIRWERPGQGLVMPGDFIPVAEQSMLIADLGRWVLHEALRQQAAWVAAGIQLSVGLNISGRHAASDRIVDDVRDALAVTGVDPRSIVVELTETVGLSDDAVVHNLEQLRALGVRIALDDFGTGFTSIGQLQRLPVDILKIDRSFVSTDDPAGIELVALMIRAGHAFGLPVVAEGVEERAQVEWLTALGCDAAQGYLFARPMPACDVPAASRALALR